VETMSQVAARAVELMPPASRFRPQDAEVIAAHTDWLLTLEHDLVAAFYDTLYDHGPTAAVFTAGERPMREATLSNWWQRTANGPLDDRYFSWMALVGLVHVLRGVENPMMLAMADHVVGLVADAAAGAGLPSGETEHLVEAFRRLASAVRAIITCGYDQAVVGALYNVAGMPEGLVRRLRDQEVAAALATAREQVGG
jgi:hypothetical protein